MENLISEYQFFDITIKFAREAWDFANHTNESVALGVALISLPIIAAVAALEIAIFPFAWNRTGQIMQGMGQGVGVAIALLVFGLYISDRC